MESFREFIQERGVVGLAIGFIFGSAVSQLVNSFMDNLINPLVGLLLGHVEGLRNASVKIAGASFEWGSFAMALLNFVILAFVVYLSFKFLRLDKLDKPKEGRALDQNEVKTLLKRHGEIPPSVS